jgi:hypothetical protein
MSKIIKSETTTITEREDLRLTVSNWIDRKPHGHSGRVKNLLPVAVQLGITIHELRETLSVLHTDGMVWFCTDGHGIKWIQSRNKR